MWQRPDPVPLPKTMTTPLDDGSVFHAFVKRRPLYEFVPADAPDAVAEAALPPVVHDSQIGAFRPRDLTDADKEEIQSLRGQDAQKWTVPALAEHFQCAKYQIRELVLPRRSTADRQWKWFYGKRYAKSAAK